MAVPFAQKLFNTVSLYSMMIVIGMCTAYALLCVECKRRELPGDTAVDIPLIAIPCGIIGARLYYVFMRWPQYASQPIRVLYIWEGGLGIYGGIIGGILALWVYARKKKLSLLTLTDALLPCVLIAQAIGRWGNYFNMEAFGPKVANPLLQFFPLCVLIYENGQWVWHMATFFYESMWNLAGFLFLWRIRKHVTAKGDMTCWYFLVYGSGRFMIEQLRADSLYIGTLKASEWLSFLFCIVSCVLLLRHQGKRTLPALLCVFTALSRFLTVDCTFPVQCAIFCTTGLLLIFLCRQKPRSLLFAIVLTVLSLAFLLFKKLSIPVSAGFSKGLLCAFLSLALPCCTALLYFSDRKDNYVCQTEP